MNKHSALLGFLIGTFAILVFFLISMAVLTFSPRGTQRSLFFGNGIGVIEITSTIFSSRRPLEQIKEFREDDSIRGILIRIDSPGGAVGPAQEIYAEILKTRAVKPVVASLGGTAASGGYYIACAADLIVANPGTLTGSIGAIMEFFNLEGLLKWAGIENEVVKSGQHKDMGSLTRNLSKKERALLQVVIEDVLDQFVRAIAQGRNLPVESILPLADGRIFTGAQALKHGLVDRLGNFNDAVDAAAELAGIKGEPHLVRFKERKMDLLDLFLDNFLGKVQNRFEESLGRISTARFPSLSYR